MLHSLSREERLQLMRFVCSFAWADLEIRDEERAYVADLIKRLELDEAESNQVAGWLNLPPAPEEVDPMQIPVKHRQIFLDAMLGLVGADGNIDEAETESFNLLSQLVR
jgi:uncharacterized tellurite resistance protein B-like protein